MCSVPGLMKRASLVLSQDEHLARFVGEFLGDDMLASILAESIVWFRAILALLY